MYDDVIIYTGAKHPKVKRAISNLQKKTPNLKKI